MESPTPEPQITEAQLVTWSTAFYAKVRLDPDRPIFNAIVGDWPRHLDTSRTSGPRSCSLPVATKAPDDDPPLPLDPDHFERWLSLFAETATEIFPPAIAAPSSQSHNESPTTFKSGIALQRAGGSPSTVK
jgi:hemoglobin